MIDDFENVKKQLTELATVINTFKSEAVQVRIVELLLGTSQSTVDDGGPARPPSAPRKRKTKRSRPDKVAAKDATTKTKPKRTATSGTGPTAMLLQLLDGDFFNSPKTINDIVEHFKHKMARTIRPSDISGKLGRLTRDEKISRSKNSDGQYEYTKP